MHRGCRGSGETSEAELSCECCIITLSAPTLRSFCASFILIFKLTTSLFQVSNFMVTVHSD